MTEQELRLLVRDAIARQTHAGTPAGVPGVSAVPASFLRHPSHGTFVLPTGSEADGPCIIEPAVMCNHCGYCKSYGH
jgi:hypothetical protein